jgi:hypothetical protein
MPSFDIVSEIDQQELDNAINQAKKEIETRYDFRGSKSKIDFDKKENLIKLLSDDDFKMKTVIDIIQSKAIKRSIDMKALDVGKIEPGPDGLVKSTVKLKNGIDQDTAKKIVKEIKNAKMKVQAQIQDIQVRISGKKRDDLQAAITFVKGKDFGLPLQFGNFRD